MHNGDQPVGMGNVPHAMIIRGECVECGVPTMDPNNDYWYSMMSHYNWIDAFRSRFSLESSFQMIMGQSDIAMKISVYLNGEDGPFLCDHGAVLSYSTNDEGGLLMQVIS